MTRDEVIARQHAALEALYRRHVGPGDPYALVDFPDHPNVGDSAIWLGEIAMLRGITGRDPAYVCTWEDFDGAAFHAACPDGALFLHGGGNLGDIWPHHQRFRESVLRDVRDRAVVQLPQSIHYRDPGNAASFVALASGHPDFHLYARDARSLRWGERHLTCPAMLAPDSAFALGPQTRPPATCAALMLLRGDDERVALDLATLAMVPDAIRCDWLEDGALPIPGPGEPRAAALERRARARVDRGLALLGQGRRMVTDRLHAHILALLLDIRHAVLDNEYGKIAAYVETWTAAWPGVRRVASAAEAADWLAAEAA